MVGCTPPEAKIQNILALNRKASRSRDLVIELLAIPPIPARSGAIYLASATVPVYSAAEDLRNSTPEARQMSGHAEAVGMVGGAKAEGATHTKLIDVVSCVYLCYVCPVSFSHVLLLSPIRCRCFRKGCNPTALERQEWGVSCALPESHI